jgi:hypothetical protein
MMLAAKAESLYALLPVIGHKDITQPTTFGFTVGDVGNKISLRHRLDFCNYGNYLVTQVQEERVATSLTRS